MSHLLHILKRGMSSHTINHVTVIGGGLMGSGIAQVAATTGHQVTLVEMNATLLEKARASIATNLERVAKKQFKDDPQGIKKFVSESLNRIQGSTDLAATVTTTDLVIEAIVENLAIKQKMFAQIDKVFSTIFLDTFLNKLPCSWRLKERSSPQTLPLWASGRSQRRLLD